MTEAPHSAPSSYPEPLRLRPLVHSIYFGPNGLRAGWRILVFFVIFSASLFAMTTIRNLGPEKGAPGRIFLTFDPPHMIYGELFTFCAYFLATWLMALIEGRRIADYGLPASGAIGLRPWMGALLGFGSITALLAALRVTGAFHFGTMDLRGAAIWKDAALWTVAFLCVGLQEEFGSRGYLLFTLSTGIGFWPAAILTSVVFGMLHLLNPGENAIGVLSAGATGFFLCMLLRKTGDLWAPIGFHAAWDWGQTFVYGVPDSGLAAPGHLFSASFSGPRWLTGGSAGPEASLFCLVLTFLLCVAVAVFLPDAKYPNPAAIPDPRGQHEAIPSPLASS